MYSTDKVYTYLLKWTMFTHILFIHNITMLLLLAFITVILKTPEFEFDMKYSTGDRVLKLQLFVVTVFTTKHLDGAET